MNLYTACKILHLLALTLWLGHMIYWSLIVGPLTKRFDPPEEGAEIRRLSLRFGGLGWPALTVLIVTGTYMIWQRGVLDRVSSGELLQDPFGRVLVVKAVLVLLMVLYQWRVGHRPAPKLIYLNMLVALLIVGLSVILIRDPSFLPGGR